MYDRDLEVPWPQMTALLLGQQVMVMEAQSEVTAPKKTPVNSL